MRYLPIVLALFFLNGCIEAKKAGDESRKMDELIAEYIYKKDPSPVTAEIASRAKYNVENPISVFDFSTSIGLLKTAFDLSEPYITATGIGAALTAALATLLKIGESYVNNKKEKKKLIIEKEVAKRLPKESHEAYQQAKDEVLIEFSKKKGT